MQFKVCFMAIFCELQPDQHVLKWFSKILRFQTALLYTLIISKNSSTNSMSKLKDTDCVCCLCDFWQIWLILLQFIFLLFHVILYHIRGPELGEVSIWLKVGELFWKMNERLSKTDPRPLYYNLYIPLWLLRLVTDEYW